MMVVAAAVVVMQIRAINMNTLIQIGGKLPVVRHHTLAATLLLYWYLSVNDGVTAGAHVHSS
jgi:hypothetical protein